MLSFQKKKESQPVVSRFPMLQSWKVPAGIALLEVVIITAIQSSWLCFTDRPSLDFAVVVICVQILFSVWVWFLSRIEATWHLVTISTFVAAHIGLLQLVRLDGFAGDGRPIWTWRWTPSPQAAMNWEQHRATKVVSHETIAVDLTQTTPFDYPAFRGGNRTGEVQALPLACDWKTTPPRLLWKQPIGAAWSSFAVVGNYCITQEQRNENEATVCYELQTGHELWSHNEPVRFYEVTSSEGPRATPTIHEGHVYAVGATGILNCLHGAHGQPIWSINILTQHAVTNRLFGVTNSPLVTEGLVIVNPGGNGSSLAAYHKQTGEQVWKAGKAGASYSSPQLVELCGQRQVLDFNAEGLYAHDLASGEILWSIPWISNPQERNNVCQPVVFSMHGTAENDSVFIASGYGMGCAVFHVLKNNQDYTVTEQWHNRNLKAKFSSVVTHNGHVYGFDDAILTCLDLATGERRWKAGRYGHGQLILADSLLLVQLESGEIAMVEASLEAFRELGRFEVLTARTWNHPVLAGKYLVVRNDREAACYELPLQPNAPNKK